ncbi:MAG: iron-containing alcohol dehydrogenase, partial [Mucinivorans sp.]
MIVVTNAWAELEKQTASGRTIVVTDTNIRKLYGSLMAPYQCITIEPGEEHKTMQTVEKIHRELLAMHADRSTRLVGLGGGIVTDITGFVASTYMRGVDFGFVPTT